MAWSSRTPALAAAIDQGIRAGLAAGALFYKSEVVRRLMQGYTTGAFSHGGAGVAGSPYQTPVERVGDTYETRVGSNVPYALFWELGHVNIFIRQGLGASSLLQKGEYHLPGGGVTGTYQRVEIWRPLLAEHAQTIRARAWAALEARILAMRPT